MRHAFFSDIHGNLEALDAVLADIRRVGADRLTCLGDVVGYGASPNECVAVVVGSGAGVVAGNHDHAAIGKVDISDFNDQARAAILWTREELADESAEWLGGLPLVLRDPELRAVHASPGQPEDWNYVLGPYDALQEFRNFDEPLCFVGHSHVPGLFLETPGGVEELPFPGNDPQALAAGRRFLVNVGSVGQPRDRDPRAAWVLYDSTARRLTLHRLAYDMEAAQQRIYDAGLPPFLAYRLGLGI